MKIFFSIALALMVCLSLVMWYAKPAAVNEGKTALVWVSDNNPMRQQQIETFNRMHPQYDLRLDPSNFDMAKIILQCLGGVGPDMFECSKSMLAAFVRAEMVWDITDELKARGIDLEQEVWPCVLDDVRLDGRIYGFPRNVAVDALWFNKDIFEQAGLDYPSPSMTWEEFIPLAQHLTVRDVKGRIVRFGFVFEWWQWVHFLKQWGGSIYTSDGTGCALDSPQAVAAIQFMQDLIYRYEVCPSPEQETAMATTGGWGSGAITWFGSQRVATALGGRWWLCALRNKSDYPDLSLGLVPCPLGPSGQYLGYCGAVAINRLSPRREQALNFITFMAGPQYNQLINHQADGISALMEYAEQDAFLRDPAFPAEDFNRCWTFSLQRSVPEDTSPFVEQSVMARIVMRQLDLVKANQKNAHEAMSTATREINQAIEQRLGRDSALRVRYQSLIQAKEVQP